MRSSSMTRSPRARACRGRGSCASVRRGCRRSSPAGRTTRTGPGRRAACRGGRARIWRYGSLVMSVPSNMIVPAVGSRSRRSTRPTVDLPEPDSPTSPRVPPGLDREVDAVDGAHVADRAPQHAAADREVLGDAGPRQERAGGGRGARVGVSAGGVALIGALERELADADAAGAVAVARRRRAPPGRSSHSSIA